MDKPGSPVVFGEVLFDCFPDGKRVLGGAPFNVAWHLQAFGDNPCFISRVGNDEPGREILGAMADWGMDTANVQTDAGHPTGQVSVTIVDDEPHYDIVADCAYDFIEQSRINIPADSGLLYHGTLGLRNATSRGSLQSLIVGSGLPVFLDVNLRAPWWRRDEVLASASQARWVKLNEHELHLLGNGSDDLAAEMAAFQAQHELELLIVTRGEHGALVRSTTGEVFSKTPRSQADIVDTVGAGDAFTAVFLHGLVTGLPIEKTLDAAQEFASAVVGLRGATTDDRAFYSRLNSCFR